MKNRKLLYLHGFNSSPQSHKAQLVSQYLAEKNCSDRLICPLIPEVPGDARRFLEDLAEQAIKEGELSYVGSSLGGYYATYLAEKYGGSAVLINPSVKPYETLKAYLGENRFYFDEGCWEFDETHIQQLQEMDVKKITQPERYLVLLQTGDETLDYREAEAMYKGSRCIIEQGGDHGFVGLERYLAEIMAFCGIECG